MGGELKLEPGATPGYPWRAMTARLSVSLVTFDPDAALLERTVCSLAAAAARANEAGLLIETRLFLVDNGPASKAATTSRAAHAWPPSLGSVEVIAGHGNVGFGRGNNLALAKVASDFHLVLNPDVEMDAEALTAALSAMREHPDVGLVAPAAFGDDGKRQYLCKRLPTPWVLFLRGFAPRPLRERFAHTLAHYEMRDVIGDDFMKGIPLASGCFLFARTQLLRAVGGFDPDYFMYFEDYDLSLRAGRRAAIAYVPQARIVHHGGDASRKGLRHVLWFLRSAARFFARHGWR